MEYLYSIPGMEDVEDVIVSSRPEHVAQLAKLLRPHHSTGRHRLHGPGCADVERLQVVLLPDVLRRQGADGRAEGSVCNGAQVAVRLDQGGEGWNDDAGDRLQVALSEGGVRLRGRRPGRCQPVGTRPRTRSVRSAGDLAHLVARSPDRDQARDGLRARDAAREDVPVGRAHRGDAHRARGPHRDHLELPGPADHRGRSDAGVRSARR